MMSRLLVLAALAVGACAPALSGPKDIEVPTVALRATGGASATDVAGALREAGARVALVAAPGGEDWFRTVATATELTLSGPAQMDDLGFAFLAPEPVGDTTLALQYEGGSLVIHDALYEMEEDRLLDLIAFRITEDTDARRAVRSLLEYVATDVNNAAALVMAVAVPSAAVGDSVARMLSPAYYDAIRCEVGQAGTSRAGVRMFYGPAARMYCEDATVAGEAGWDWVRAQLVMGRR
jgi:hypothetical protein